VTRNIVLLTIDSLRADCCGFLNSQSDLTPTLDGLASSGLVFEQAIAPGPRTPSSMPVVFSGEYMPPKNIDLRDWKQRRSRINRHLERFGTVAARMRNRGYDTIGATANPWTQRTAFANDFRNYLEIDSRSALSNSGCFSPFALLDRIISLFDYVVDLNWQNKRDWFITWNGFLNQILEAVDEARGPVFLWIFLLDTHEPYLSVPKYREENSVFEMYHSAWRQHELDPINDTPSEGTQSTLSSAYRDAVRSIDGFTERLLADIDFRDPLLIFHSDHGESFGEHGTFGHQQQLYEENIHVPLFVHNAELSKTVSKPFSLRSLSNLLTDLAQPVDSLRPSKYTSDYVCATTEQGHKTTIRGQRWKYITSEGKDELYDLRKDPEEQRNLADDRKHLLGSMRRLLIKRQTNRAERNGIESAVRSIFSEV